MRSLWRETAIVFILVLVSTVTAVATEEQRVWFGGMEGWAEVVAFTEDEANIFQGMFRFRYPTDFQINIGSEDEIVRITGHDGFLEVQSGEERYYGYDQHWLYQYFESYLIRLLALAKSPLEFSGPTQIASFEVFRYIHRENPEFVYWFDQDTGIPLLIREGTETLLVIDSYKISSQPQEEILELEVAFPPYPATLVFVRGNQSWELQQMLIQEPDGELVVEFANWEFGSWNQDSSLSMLVDLKELNDRFLEEFQEEKWEEALLTCEEMRRIAPEFWQVYLYQAFIYEGLDNFFGVVENYQQVLMRDPHNALALNNLAYHYFLKEIQLPLALEMAEQAVALERKSAYLDTLGYGYYLAGYYQEAEELLEEALIDATTEDLPEIQGHLKLVRKALKKESIDK